MYRDVGNEIVVAIAAVGVIAFALVFGILLSLSGGQVGTPTATVQTVVAADVSVTPTFGGQAISTSTPTATRTATDSATSTPTATMTEVFTPSPGITMTTAPCAQPPTWKQYVVQPGNTLFSIAQAVGSTVSELMRVNCLANPDRILTGDILFVPRLPDEPVRTNVPLTPRGTDTPGGGGLVRVGCTTPDRAFIANLIPGQRVSGSITVGGTAHTVPMGSYKLEVRPDFASVYNFWSSGQTPVVNGALGTLDTSRFGPGLHWLRLVVVEADSSTPPGNICVVPLVFE